VATNRKLRLARRRPGPEELDPDLEGELIFGAPFVGPGCRGDRSLLAAAWKQYCETILPAFIQKNPGRRPFAWWLLEHGKERPINPDVPDAVAASIRQQNTYYGYLHSAVMGKWGGAVTWFQEPEEEYLRRHRLLTSKERKALAEAPEEANGAPLPLIVERAKGVAALTAWLTGSSSASEESERL
jgi:hypothetical protein